MKVYVFTARDAAAQLVSGDLMDSALDSESWGVIMVHGGQGPPNIVIVTGEFLREPGQSAKDYSGRSSKIPIFITPRRPRSGFDY